MKPFQKKIQILSIGFNFEYNIMMSIHVLVEYCRKFIKKISADFLPCILCYNLHI
jgi:hypothetical protein